MADCQIANVVGDHAIQPADAVAVGQHASSWPARLSRRPRSLKAERRIRRGRRQNRRRRFPPHRKTGSVCQCCNRLFYFDYSERKHGGGNARPGASLLRLQTPCSSRRRRRTPFARRVAVATQGVFHGSVQAIERRLAASVALQVARGSFDWRAARSSARRLTSLRMTAFAVVKRSWLQQSLRK